MEFEKLTKVCVRVAMALMFSLGVANLLEVIVSASSAVAIGFPAGFVVGWLFWGKIMEKDKKTAMTIPKNIPESGFYYHYKHKPNGEVNHYAYEVLGAGCHTEDDCRPADAHMVVYRPLYESAKVYKAGKLFDLRPLSMFMETVDKDGAVKPRFQKITSPDVITQLQQIKEKMYS